MKRLTGRGGRCARMLVAGGILAGLTVALTSAFLPTSVVALVSAHAASCPGWSNVKSFGGTVSIGFDATTAGPSGTGTATVTLSRNAGLVFPVGSINPHYETAGPPGHRQKLLLGFVGALRKDKATAVVDDSYENTSSSPTTVGHQMAAGPPLDGHVSIGFDPLSCEYSVNIGYEIKTHGTGSWPSPPDKGASATAEAPLRRIPSNRHLNGVAEIPLAGVEGQGTGNENSTTGFLTIGDLFGSGDMWGSEYWDIQVNEDGQSPGSATITWHLTPH